MGRKKYLRCEIISKWETDVYTCDGYSWQAYTATSPLTSMLHFRIKNQGYYLSSHWGHSTNNKRKRVLEESINASKDTCDLTVLFSAVYNTIMLPFVTRPNHVMSHGQFPLAFCPFFHQYLIAICNSPSFHLFRFNNTCVFCWD